jgi:hypothetical protein
MREVIVAMLSDLIILFTDSWIVKLTWNILISNGIFQLPHLNYSMAFALVLLCRCLFKSPSVRVRN